jgi:hypothetical protein
MTTKNGMILRTGFNLRFFCAALVTSLQNESVSDLRYDSPFPKLPNRLCTCLAAYHLGVMDVREALQPDPKIPDLGQVFLGKQFEDVTTSGAYYQCSSIHVRGRR